MDSSTLTVDERLLGSAIDIAVEAGKKALEFYGQNVPIEYKSDNSPLTLADKAAHESIVRALSDLTPGIPVLSEESEEVPTAERKSWTTFWLVDPLDGSKEFIKQSGEFTVNIALVEGDETTLGAVHVPISGLSYSAIRGSEPASASEGESDGRGEVERTGGAWVHRDGDRQAISTRKGDLKNLTVVASRDHAGPVVQAFLSAQTGARITSMGSSLKFCLVAEGKADFYPRVVPTMEWDTGAAQCILEVAGGQVTNLEGNRLAYNKNDLRNPSLMAFGDPSIDWVRVFPG